MKRRGFSLVEALVSVTILAVGIVGSLMALSQMTKGESRIRESVQFRELAQQRLDEAISTGEIQQAPLDGNFSERGLSSISYQIETEPGTVENMLIVRAKTYFTSKGEESGATITTLIFQAPVEQEQPAGRPR